MRLDDIHTGPEKERSAPRFLFGKVPWILYTKRLCYARRHLINTSTHKKKKDARVQIDRNRQTDSKRSILLFIYYFRFKGGIFFFSLSFLEIQILEDLWVLHHRNLFTWSPDSSFFPQTRITKSKKGKNKTKFVHVIFALSLFLSYTHMWFWFWSVHSSSHPGNMIDL